MPRYARVVDTRTRIVDAAIALFNRHGVAAISTNHVAAALEISPGNLYYHFRNKDEIVRAAFDRLAQESDASWDGIEGRAEDLVRLVVDTIALYSRYLFLARELPALLIADPALRRRYHKLQARRIEQLETILEALVSHDVLRRPRHGTLRTLAESCWILAMFWLPHVELAGERPDLARGANLVLQVLEPHLRDGVHEVLSKVIALAADEHALPSRVSPVGTPRSRNKPIPSP